MPQDYCDFLQSNGFVIVSGNIVSLVHQSVLDCFFSEYMLDSFYDGNKVADIIGVKEKQTPGRLMLKYRAKKNEKNLYRYEEEYVLEDSNMLIREYRKVIEILMPFIPTDEQSVYSEWSSKYFYKATLERACIQIVKKANKQFAQQEPEILLGILSNYMGTGNALHNEIVLDALLYFPNSYKDYIISYLCKFFDKAILEYTSGNGNQLLLAKRVFYAMQRHSIF